MLDERICTSAALRYLNTSVRSSSGKSHKPNEGEEAEEEEEEAEEVEVEVGLCSIFSGLLGHNYCK